MKTIFLALIFLFAPQGAFAAPVLPCSDPNAGRPCVPDESAKKDILEYIQRAEKADPKVKNLKANYLAIQNNPKISLEKKLAVFEDYFLAQMAQNELYKQAMELTGRVYHIAPDRTNIKIGRPTDTDMNYIWGLDPIWNPQVGEFDLKGRFAVKIEGFDREFHYSGANRDDGKGREKKAITFEDGRVFIFKELFKDVLRYKKPGLLALNLYHESRHFNQLSRPSLDGSGETRSLASVEEDERDALKACMDVADAFELDQEDVDDIIEQWAGNDARVNNKQLTRRTIDPAKEALRKQFYEEVQFNFIDEYFKLNKAVDAEKEKQRELQAIARKEREQERAARERAATPSELVDVLSRCWYQPIYRSRTDETIIAFKDEDARHPYERGPTSEQGLKILMLITRACDDIRRGVAPEKNKACNDAAPDLRNPMSYDLVLKSRRRTGATMPHAPKTFWPTGRESATPGRSRKLSSISRKPQKRNGPKKRTKVAGERTVGNPGIRAAGPARQSATTMA